MIITKEFEGEMAHIVRNCSTERCKRSIHGHSYKVLVSLKSNCLDNAGMICDFGLMKGSIKQFIDSFDHCTVLWNKDDEEYINSIKKYSARWISLPFNPSAELLSRFILSAVNGILKSTNFENNEGVVRAYSVQYYETRTGSATSFAEEDLNSLTSIFREFPVVEFSEAVMKDWSSELLNWVKRGAQIREDPYEKYFSNPIVDQQVIAW